MSDAFRRLILSVVFAATVFLTTIAEALPVALSHSNIATGLFPKGQIVGFWYEPKVALNDGDKFGALDEAPTTSQDAVTLVEDLKKRMLEIKSNGMREDGSAVDYDTIKALPAFGKYLRLVRNLKDINLEELSSAQKKSCLINLYNCLLVHAVISGLLDLKGGTVSRLKLYAKASYNIGGILYSLNDIENGLLRGNRKSAVPLTFRPFRRSDDLRRKIMLDCDPRIHFALNCGAKSCPPIGVYSSTEVEEQLNRATVAFLNQSVFFDEVSKTVTLSMLFSWYQQDFGSTNTDILGWIKTYASKDLADRVNAFQAACRPLEPKIKFAVYDWNLNNVI